MCRPDGRHVLNNQGTDDYVLTLQCLLKRLEQAQLEEGESDIAEEVLKNAEDSHM